MYNKSSFLRNKKIFSFPVIALLVLRFLSVSLVSLFLLSPFIKRHFRHVEKPFVIVATDNSESVVLNKDSQYYKHQFIKDLDNFVERLSKKYLVVNFTFGSEVKKNNRLSFTEKRTDIAELMEKIYEETYNRNAGAVVILSDGIYNQGNDPLLTPQMFNCPVYTVALGDTTAVRDLKIKNIIHNDISFLGNQFPVRVFIEAKQCKGKNAVLKVKHRENVIYSKNIFIKDNYFFDKADFLIDAKDLGIQKYTVSLSYLENELTWKNNQQDFFVEILENKNQVILIANSPHPDISAIRSVFDESNNFEIKTYFAYEVESNPSLLNQLLSKPSVVILHQLPAENQPVIKTREYLGKLNIPVLYILGGQSSAGLFNQLNTGLQINQNRRIFENAQPVINNNFNYFNLDHARPEIIAELPPLNVFYGNYKVSAENQVVFFQKIGNVSTNYPLYVLVRSAVNRTGIICGDGIWRWKMTENRLTGKTDFFNELISKTIQFLSLKEDKRLFKLSQNKFIFNEDEAVEIFAELLNKNYEKQRNADIKLKIIGGQNKETLYQFQETNEGYKVNAGYFPAGQYQLIAETFIDGQKQTAKGMMIVRKTELEQLELTANHQLMFNLAKNSAGKMYYPSSLNELAKEILENKDIKPVTYFNFETKDLIDNKLILAIIVFLMAAEWFIRKFYGSY